MSEGRAGSSVDGKEADTPGRANLKRGWDQNWQPCPNFILSLGDCDRASQGEKTAHERLRGNDWMSEIEQKTEAGRKFLSSNGPPGVVRVAVLSHRGKDR